MNQPRINGATERRLDSMAMLVLMYNEFHLPVPALINEQLDELGIIMLGNLRTAQGLSPEQLQIAIVAKDEKLRAANLVRLGDDITTAARKAATVCDEGNHEFVGTGDQYFVCSRCGTVMR